MREPSEEGGTPSWSEEAKARVAEMGNGGFRPAYNVQLATTTVGAWR